MLAQFDALSLTFPDADAYLISIKPRIKVSNLQDIFRSISYDYRAQMVPLISLFIE